MKRRRSKQDSLLTVVEREARAMLRRPKLTNAERLKALELIRHRVADKEDEHGAFFAADK